MARRVNTKFLTVLTVVIVVIGVAALAANKFLIKESPEKYLNLGNQALADKRYEDAAKHFGRAVGLDKNNPALWVQYGDALNQLSPLDAEYMKRARAAWDQALAVDPNNKPALDRMMQFWSDIANMTSVNPDVFAQLEKTATNLYAADPKNTAAEIAIQTAVIRPWLAGVEKDETKVEKTIDKLVAMIEKYPDNPDLPLFAAQGKLRMAERYRQRGNTAEFKKRVEAADKIITEAVNRNPKSAAMYFSAAQVTQVQEVLAGTTAAAADWKKKKQEYFAKARELSKPEDPLYVHIHIAAARSAGDTPGESEKILRKLLESQPDDQQVRLALAEELARTPGKQQEAIDILDKPFATNQMKGVRAFMIRELQIRTLIMATNLRLEQFNTSKKEDRDKLLPKITDTLATIEQKDGVDSPRPLRLRGKLLRMQGDTIKAIQTLEKARALAEKQANSADAAGADRLDRWEVIDLLARCYIETNQTGRAKQLLGELINKFPTYEPGRMLLAQVLIREGNRDEAWEHVKILKERRPNDPDVIKMELQVRDPKGGVAQDTNVKPEEQAARLKATYASLPEKTKAEILDKVIAAMAVDQQEDAVRLLDRAQKEFAGDFDVARTGLRVYRHLNQLDKAKAYVESAYKANPKDEKLAVLQRQVQDLTPQGIRQSQLDEINKLTDPLRKSLALAEFYTRDGKLPEALKELQNAQNLRPKDNNITALIFRNYLRQGQFDKAELLVEPLAAANQDQAGGLLFRYQIAMGKGDLATAEERARALVQRMGEFGQSWLALGQVLQAQGKIEDARSKYLVALEKQSDSPDALRGIIDCCYALSQPGEARKYIERARRALPQDPGFKEIEVRHELNYGDPAKALPSREEAVAKTPDKPDQLLSLGQTYLSVARARSMKPDPDHRDMAAEMFTKARNTFRQGISKWPDEIAFYAYYAETSARDGNLGDSEKVLKDLLARPAWKDKAEPKALLAEFYAVTRRYTEAEALFRDILAKEPTNADVQVRLSNLLTSQNKIDDALKVLSTNVQDARVARRRVEILIAAERSDEADQVVTDALTKSPSNIELLHLGASVDMNAGRFERAEKRLARAVEIDAANPTTQYYLGALCLKQPKPDYDKAIAYFTKGKESPTVGTEARFALSDCLKRLGNAEASLRELEGALSSQPGNMRVRLGLVDAYLNTQPPRWVDAERVINDAKTLPGYMPNADLLEREATMRTQRGEPEKAFKAMQEARNTAPNDMAIARKYLRKLLQLSRWPEVNQEADKLLAQDKTLWWAYTARAEARRRQGKKEESVKDFEAALAVADQLRDDNAADEIVRTMGDVIGADEVIDRIRKRADTDNRFKFMIARLQATKGDNAMAIKTMEQILAEEEKLQPGVRESVLRFAAMLYLVGNQPDKSAKCYERLLTLAPDDLISLNNMACLLAETVQPPRPQDGIKYSQHAYSLMRAAGRRDAVVMDTHGWLLTLTDKVDEGIELLRSARETSELPDIHYHLGEAYLRKQYADEAKQELQRAKDMIEAQQKDKSRPDVYLQQLQNKVENALARALTMQNRKGTAIVPTGTNVP